MSIANTVLIAGKGVDGTPQAIEVGPGGAVYVTDLPQNVLDNPIVYNVALALANTEYAQALPVGCRGFEFHCRTANDVRFAFETGRVAAPVAPYMTLPSGLWYYNLEVRFDVVWTLYLASAVAAVVAEIIAWT